MTFNSLLMFDIVFVFFLFLVGVTCLVYYLPPAKHDTTLSSDCRHKHNHSSAHGHYTNHNDYQREDKPRYHDQRHQHHPHHYHHHHNNPDHSHQCYRHQLQQQYHHHRHHDLNPHCQCQQAASNACIHDLHEYCASNLLFANNYDANWELFTPTCIIDNDHDNDITITSMETVTETAAAAAVPPPPPPPVAPHFCYIKAKQCDIKKSTGPIEDV